MGLTQNERKQFSFCFLVLSHELISDSDMATFYQTVRTVEAVSQLNTQTVLELRLGRDCEPF